MSTSSGIAALFHINLANAKLSSDHIIMIFSVMSCIINLYSMLPRRKTHVSIICNNICFSLWIDPLWFLKCSWSLLFHQHFIYISGTPAMPIPLLVCLLALIVNVSVKLDTFCAYHWSSPLVVFHFTCHPLNFSLLFVPFRLPEWFYFLAVVANDSLKPCLFHIFMFIFTCNWKYLFANSTTL